MRALVCREGRPDEVARRGRRARRGGRSPPGRVPPRGIRVRVICASLNFADCLLVRNLYQEKPALPFTPGGEFCGAVLELGAELQKGGPFRVGQVVAGAVVGGGAMAEELVVPDASASAFVVPAGISPAAASSFPIAYGTAYMALAQRARVGPGTRVLVLGAGGGVGLAAVQIAKASAPSWSPRPRRGESRGCRAAGADACLDSDALHASSDTKHTNVYQKKKETFESAPVGDARRVRRGKSRRRVVRPRGRRRVSQRAVLDPVGRPGARDRVRVRFDSGVAFERRAREEHHRARRVLGAHAAKDPGAEETMRTPPSRGVTGGRIARSEG